MIVCVRVDYTYLDSQCPRERTKSICERLSWNGRTKRNSPRSKRGRIGWMVAMLPTVGCWSLAAWSKRFFDCFWFMPPHLWKGVCVFVGRCQNDGCGGEFHGVTFKYSHRSAGNDHPQRSGCLRCPWRSITMHGEPRLRWLFGHTWNTIGAKLCTRCANFFSSVNAILKHLQTFKEPAF